MRREGFGTLPLIRPLWGRLPPGEGSYPLKFENGGTKDKTSGQRGGKDLPWDNLERIKMGILCEAVALVLSGKLDELEEATHDE